MRIHNTSSDVDRTELTKFSDWLAELGDGTIGVLNDSGANIDIPDDILISGGDYSIGKIVQSMYPDFENNVKDSIFLQNRAILAPTLAVVDSINEYMIRLNDNTEKTYLISDSACKSDTNVDVLVDVHTPKFLNTLKCSSVPNHELKLKVETPVMFLRNIDHSKGLCNGIRLVITRLGKHILEGKVLTGTNSGELVLIPRLPLTPSDPRLPFKFQRRQIPIIVSYSMSINKSQGQSLSHVALFLKKPVFSHGQLYVALSRVTNRKRLKILVCDEDNVVKNTTKKCCVSGSFP